MSGVRQGLQLGFLWWLLCTTFCVMQLASASPILSSAAAPVSAEVLQLREDNAALKRQVERLMHELLVLKRRLFGRAAEASDQLQIQGQLFGDPIVEVDLPAGVGTATGEAHLRARRASIRARAAWCCRPTSSGSRMCCCRKACRPTTARSNRSSCASARSAPSAWPARRVSSGSR